ncbi:MAG: hypothetical protein K6T83_20305, partial [Alicyclobacillus sp.]|nr:hypothetical protein [Alicyclobacillus sp.]
SINHHATGGLQPDLTLLFDVPVEVSQARVAAAAGSGPDRIERRGPEYFTCVRDAFLRIAEANQHRVKVVNAARDVDAVEQDIWRHVANLLEQEHDSQTGWEACRR